jgi:hypothetical protein
MHTLTHTHTRSHTHTLAHAHTHPHTLTHTQSLQPAHIRGVYEGLVDLLMGIKPEDVKQPRFDAIGYMEYPDLHEESLPNLLMNRAL